MSGWLCDWVVAWCAGSGKVRGNKTRWDALSRASKCIHSKYGLGKHSHSEYRPVITVITAPANLLLPRTIDKVLVGGVVRTYGGAVVRGGLRGYAITYILIRDHVNPWTANLNPDSNPEHDNPWTANMLQPSCEVVYCLKVKSQGMLL